MPNVFQKIKRIFRYRLVTKTFLDNLAKVGVDIRPMYWTKEDFGNAPPVEFKDNIEDYTFDFFGSEDLKTIVETEQKGESLDTWLAWLAEGKKCFGAKHKGDVAAYCWVFLDYQEQKGLISIEPDEAFLFYLFTLKKYRGKNIAPLIHVKLYEVLGNMGRNAVYSWTEYFNPSAKKFKKKLNAKFVKLILYVELFKKFKRGWIIKKY
jgi:GNAT superfamily N-acetyltransferase